MSRTVVNLSGRLLLIVAGLLLPLLILEIGVRIIGLAPPPIPNPAIWTPHPLMGWWHIPYSGGIFHSDFNEFEAEIYINARGLRDREIGYNNPNKAVRVLSLADSFGEALQVNLEETYHKQLETMLADSLSRPVEVINAGVGGWGTDQEAIFYVAEGFRYNPDVLLLSFFIRNDTVNNYGPLEIARNGGEQQKQFFNLSSEGQLIQPSLEQELESNNRQPISNPDSIQNNKPWLLPLADGLWRVSSLYRFVIPYLRDIPSIVQTLGPSGILGGEAVVRAGHPAIPIPFFIYQSPLDEQFEAAWDLTEAIIAQLNIEVEKRGTKLVVAIIAAPEQVYPAQWEGLLAANPEMQAKSWDLEMPNRRLTAFLTEQNIPYIDLLPVFRQASANPKTPPLHFRHDQHWTAEGHHLAASAIHDFILEWLK